MAKFRYIYCKLWSDSKLMNFSFEEKYLFIYLLTNEFTKECGIYEIDLKHMEIETGLSFERLLSCIDKLQNTYDKIKYNPETGEVAIKNWTKYHNSASPKVKKRIEEELSEVKDTSLIDYIYGSERPLPINEEGSSKNECDEVYTNFNNEIHQMTPTDYERINSFLEKMDSSVVVEAIKEASTLNKRSTKYIEAILSNWLKSGVTNIDSLSEYRNEYVKFKNKGGGMVSGEDGNTTGEYDDITICY